MIASKSPQERRIHPRLDKNIPVKICQEDGDIVTETANISRSGAYCRVEKKIQPMTKLKIHLLIPIKKNNKLTTRKISCSGVVVRVEPAGEQHHIAIFFNDISQRDADAIGEYVSHTLEEREKEKAA